MTRIAPPLLGYNNNVCYSGRTFHIQTEDSGTKYARVITHLFIDGGQIVKSTRTEYQEVVGKPDMAETVRRLMKDQHKNMFLALRSGELDGLIERVSSGERPTPQPIEAALSQVPRLRSESLPSMNFGAGEESRTSPGIAALPAEGRANLPSDLSASVQPGDSRAAGAAPLSGHVPSRERRRQSSMPPAGRRARHLTDPVPTDVPVSGLAQGATVSGRVSRLELGQSTPAPQAAEEPRPQSIFGDAAAGKQTLDEVILSFLEDDDT